MPPKVKGFIGVSCVIYTTNQIGQNGHLPRKKLSTGLTIHVWITNVMYVSCDVSHNVRFIPFIPLNLSDPH